MPRPLEELLAVIITFRRAPLELLGLLESRVEGFYEGLKGYADELVVLATCNRFEVYALPREGFLERLRELLGEAWGYAETLRGMEAARHLFRVAAGLESAILGENEILGQVADAYEKARRRGFVGKYLSLLFTQAVRTGKLVRSRTGISKGSVGAPGAAVKLASRLVGGFENRTVVVVGAGEAASIMAKLVREQAATARIVVVNRTVERARSLAESVQGEWAGLEALPGLLREADIVLAAVTAGKPIVPRSVLEAVAAQRNGKRLVIVDISNIPVFEQPVPPPIIYAGLEEVNRVVEEVVEARRREVPKAETLIEEQLKVFRKLWLRRNADEALAEIMRYAEKVMEEEVEELTGRLRGLGVDGAAILMARSFAQSLSKKLLRPLIVYAHEAAIRGDVASLEAIVEKFRRELTKKHRG